MPSASSGCDHFALNGARRKRPSTSASPRAGGRSRPGVSRWRWRHRRRGAAASERLVEARCRSHFTSWSRDRRTTCAHLIAHDGERPRPTSPRASPLSRGSSGRRASPGRDVTHPRFSIAPNEKSGRADEVALLPGIRDPVVVGEEGDRERSDIEREG